MTNDTAMAKAERSIAQALAELERATEGYVRGVEIIDVETTTYSDERPQMRRRAVIDLEPKPGTHWEEG